MNSQFVCGIDLGTSNSLCAVSYLHGPELVSFENATTVLPSIVRYRNDGKVIVGNPISCKDSQTIRFAKRLIGVSYDNMQDAGKLGYGSPVVRIQEGFAGFRVKQNGQEKEISPIDVEAEIFKEIQRNAVKYNNNSSLTLSTVVVGVPAKFNQYQRECTLSACRQAFNPPINVISLDEPVAAIIHYFSSNEMCKPGYYLVYDFGSGTFDVTLVQYIDYYNYTIVETDGNECLGGTDIDNAVLGLIIAKVESAHPINLRDTIENDYEKRSKLLDICEKVKIDICGDIPRTIDMSSYNPDKSSNLEIQVTIKENEFEDLVKPLIAQTFEAVDRVITKHKDIEIEAIILVGGTSSIPSIRRQLKEKYNVQISENISKTDCVAKGACIYAVNARQSNPSALGLSSIRISSTSRVSYGVAVFGGRICQIIKKGEQLPCKKEKVFTTTMDDQETISTGVYVGEGDLQKDCRLIKTIKFSGIQKAKKGIPHIKISYYIDASYNLTITCSELIGGMPKMHISETVNGGPE